MFLDIIKNKLSFEPRTILDIGANVGWWYGKAKEMWPDAFIYMIEGNPHCEKQLKEIGGEYTIALLSDKVKEVDFYTLKNDLTTTGASYYRENTKYYKNEEDVEVIKCKTKVLDELFDDESFFDLIKLDTQGSEIDILKGGSKLLQKSIVVIVEVDKGEIIKYNDGAPLKNDVIKFMEEQDFTPVGIVDRLEMDNPVPDTPPIVVQEDLVFINKKRMIINNE